MMTLIEPGTVGNAADLPAQRLPAQELPAQDLPAQDLLAAQQAIALFLDFAE